ncbi:hypothetical protein ISF_05578 [Cordyceps fumosorosea ARSEF 2679]|uniref:Uncharacterized protein n=1 Tax=Cordyceps fumosorosea (strain ARSEF 2679) TaxID=1081104 RepID=A0A167UEA8_CORFA|nr:hypothetical protein ISF_05578 [Cordyceps fumosorosea ARSEF 2679]OAA61499.1 hypothetical protein ISF_05578 [Cordyceps fumosorosea ARSEF 2679]
MVRIAAAAVLAFAVSTMALSEAVPANAAALRARQDAEEVPKPETPAADSPEDFKKWMESIAETAAMLQKLALEAAENHGKTE